MLSQEGGAFGGNGRGTPTSSVLTLIEQGLSIKSIQDKTGISRATYFRLKKIVVTNRLTRLYGKLKYST